MGSSRELVIYLSTYVDAVLLNTFIHLIFSLTAEEIGYRDHSKYRGRTGGLLGNSFQLPQVTLRFPYYSSHKLFSHLFAIYLSKQFLNDLLTT